MEIEGKKVEVSYREKVIELSKHRQEETGIKCIRRRELLPPFPEGLYLSPQERLAKDPHLTGYNMTEEFRGKPPSFPVYNSEEKFDEFYKFLTNGEYPCPGTWVHNMDYGEVGNNTGKPNESITKFKREGLYFQRIYGENELDFFTGRKFYAHQGYTTPIFIFENKNPKIREYFNNILNNPKDEYPSEVIGYDIGIKDLKRNWFFEYLKDFLKREPLSEREIRFFWFGIARKSAKEQIRWCHAECALVPTKRSLNVLFFETGDEDKEKLEE